MPADPGRATIREQGAVGRARAFVSLGNGIYIQEHLNRIWDRAGGAAVPSLPVDPSVPPA